MGFGRSRDDAPRVVGFDFGAPAPVPPAVPAPPPPPVAEQPVEAPPPPPPPAYEPAYAAPVAEPAFAAAPGWGTPPPAAPAEQPGYAQPGFESYTPPAQYVPWTPPQPPAPMPVVVQKSGIRREMSILAALVGLILVIGVVQRVTAKDSTGVDTTTAPAPTVKISLPPAIEDINAPASIGGEQRLNTRFGRALARGLRNALPNGGRFAEIEIYGFESPKYFIVAGDLMKGDNRALYNYMATPGGAMQIGPSRAYPGGMLCGNATINGGYRGSICTWATSYYKAILVSYTHGPDRLAPVAVKARKDVERGH